MAQFLTDSLTSSRTATTRARRPSWQVRLVVLALLAFAAATLWLTNRVLTDRFTLSMRNQAELRLALYGSNVISELQRASIVPQILAQDPEVIWALRASDFSDITARFSGFVEEIGAVSLILADLQGRVVASTHGEVIGLSHQAQSYFTAAMSSPQTGFTLVQAPSGQTRFFYARRILSYDQPIGVIAVEVDLQKFEQAWRGISDTVLVADAQGQILLATEPRWRGINIAAALMREPPKNAIERAMRVTSDWTSVAADTYLQGAAVLRMESKIPFQDWRVISFTAYSGVREKVNGWLALETMSFALFFATLFYLINRRMAGRLISFQKESDELKLLNQQLHWEVLERKKIQETLAVAEQSLAQHSKLAALGEMSAAVSHELNQPLAAMKTYLAGASLLLKRKRPEEALAALGRIDGLIERMGAITKQLKSYARKGGEKLQPVDMVEALGSALAIMEPQLSHSKVALAKILPKESAVVMADRLRIEQVLINL
ncbi:MAG: sensor histidine kinase, partial [Rhodobacteraceae bacterium]|nr:sensor histidine kinase [Paracoccaceae bacterium]